MRPYQHSIVVLKGRQETYLKHSRILLEEVQDDKRGNDRPHSTLNGVISCWKTLFLGELKQRRLFRATNMAGWGVRPISDVKMYPLLLPTLLYDTSTFLTSLSLKCATLESWTRPTWALCCDPGEIQDIDITLPQPPYAWSSLSYSHIFNYGRCCQDPQDPEAVLLIFIN